MAALYPTTWLAFLIATVSSVYSGPPWDALSVTFGYPGAASMAFSPLPRTLAENKGDWKMVDNGCTDSSLHYNGKRYIKDNNNQVTVIMDVKGFVAGIQIAIPKTEADLYKTQFVDYSVLPAAVPQTFNGTEYYVFTTYFVDPSIICTRGRTQKEFDQTGTGTGFYFQMSDNPSDKFVKEPMDMKKDEAVWMAQNFTKQKCFSGMGRHYFKGLDKGSDCKHIDPFFMLSDDSDDKLIAFGFVFVGNFTNTRFEHPPYDLLKAFLNNVPDCAAQGYKIAKGVTTMHVYVKMPPANCTANSNAKD